MDMLLIRHGETDRPAPEHFNASKDRPDPPLNAIGIRQAELLGARLRQEEIQRIYASDLKRAMETAEILDRFLHAGLEVREGLREIHMGRLHHGSWEDILREDPALFAAWQRHESDLAYPGGECGEDMRARAMAVLEEIAASGWERAAVVTHGGVIRSLVCGVLGIGQEKRFLFGPPENTSVSILRLDRESGKYTVHSLNDAGHLTTS